jgi:hypothetical protein
LLDSCDGEDTVLVDGEGDIDFGDTLGRGWDVDNVKVTKLVVVLDRWSFSLEDGDCDGLLLVPGR